MKKTKNRVIYLGAFIIAILGSFVLMTLVSPKASPLLKQQGTVQSTDDKNKEAISLVAIGDSLTEGVGDSTNSGGYVPLLQKELEEQCHLNVVTTKNFGKSGDRSDQITKRIKKSKEIQEGLKKADIITVTVGGNDLMATVKNELMNNISMKTFEKPKVAYQRKLTKLLAEIRKYNTKAPIYQLGIYNPFYLNFSELTEMQDIVTLWDDSSEEIIQQQENAYFIHINDLLYKGLDGNVGIEYTKKTDETTNSIASEENGTNNLISDVDNFHPNNLGYQIMANAFMEEMITTKSVWIKK